MDEMHCSSSASVCAGGHDEAPPDGGRSETIKAPASQRETGACELPTAAIGASWR